MEQSHLQGKKHKTAVVQALDRLQNGLEVRFARLKPSKLFSRCELCDVDLPTKAQHDSHFGGKLHAANVGLHKQGKPTKRKKRKKRYDESLAQVPQEDRGRIEAYKRRIANAHAGYESRIAHAREVTNPVETTVSSEHMTEFASDLRRSASASRLYAPVFGFVPADFESLSGWSHDPQNTKTRTASPRRAWPSPRAHLYHRMHRSGQMPMASSITRLSWITVHHARMYNRVQLRKLDVEIKADSRPGPLCLPYRTKSIQRCSDAPCYSRGLETSVTDQFHGVG